MPSLHIDQILDELTLDEKIKLLSGRDTWATNSVERLGIPSITVRFKHVSPQEVDLIVLGRQQMDHMAREAHRSSTG